jgi:hypothetical protein
MKRLATLICLLTLVVAGFVLHDRFSAVNAAGDDAGAIMLMHDVYFTLKDNSGDAKAKLVEACKKYLTKHPGTVAFAVGTRAEDLKRPVNDQDFDVALHIVFKTKADHAKYQDAPRHHQFIDENKETWKQVRVFDSEVTE